MRDLSRYLAVFLVAYLIGLAVFFPTHFLEKWFAGQAGNRLEWRKFEFRLGSVRLEEIRLAGQPAPMLRRMVMTPDYLQLLVGERSVKLTGEADFGRMRARVRQGEASALHIDFAAEITEINVLLPASGLQGKADIVGAAAVDRTAGKVLDGHWRAELGKVAGYGVSLQKVNAEGKMDEGRMKITVNASGDLSVTGTLTVTPVLTAPLESALAGELAIRPDAPRPDSLAAKILAGAPTRRLKISGTVGKPQTILLP